MSVRCGKGHEHESVAEVRACYGVPASGGSVGYKKNRYPGTCVKCGGKVDAEQGRVDKTDDGWQTSHLEGKCREKPAKVRVNGTVPANDRYAQIPVGHYATKSLTGNNDLDFWRVDRPEQGTYAGRTFVKRIVGGKPDLNVSRDTKFAALEAILEIGVEVSAILYGQQLGRCSRCNRHLTDEVSRQFGKGPECRSKG
jgi:hypothetical protein